MLNKMTQQNASKVALFLEENQNSFIAFPLEQVLIFTVDTSDLSCHGPGNSLLKIKNNSK